MTRTEYRLNVSWPGGASYQKSYRQEPRAARAAATYLKEGATVAVEVWGHAGEDLGAGWYLDRARTDSVMRGGQWGMWGVFPRAAALARSV